MDAGQLTENLTWNFVLTALVSAYALSVAVFLILENRSPQSTFAWLFLLLAFPFGGLGIYLMFGRRRHAFSRGRTLTKLVEGTSLAKRARNLIETQDAKIEALAERAGRETARVAAMQWASARAPVTFRNTFTILQDAQKKYPRLLADMRAASHSIHLLYYEWASDRFTSEVAEILAERVARGVEVRILYDPVGSYFMLRRRHVRMLRRAGIEMYPFSPMYRLHTLSYRNHRKIAVIDGAVGYSGGLNMTEKHLSGPDGFSGWRDTHARVTGEAVAALQTVFATMWHNTTRENLFREEYFPEVDSDGGGIPVQVVSAGPDSRWEAIRHSYLAMIALAHDRVYLQSPFLIVDTSVGEAMKTAALSGLDVRVMIAPRGAEFSPAYRAGMTYAADMARAGVKVLLYEGAYFHAKTICIDSSVCSIGSANIDIRSFSINYETNLVIYDAGVASELEADFLNDQRSCTLLRVGEYEQRSAGSRFIDSTLRLFSPLL
jgi:cardiolipin synthase